MRETEARYKDLVEFTLIRMEQIGVGGLTGPKIAEEIHWWVKSQEEESPHHTASIRIAAAMYSKDLRNLFDKKRSSRPRTRE